MIIRHADTLETEAHVAIETFARELLSHGTGAGVIFEARAIDPECALAEAYAAGLCLTRMTREGQEQAVRHVDEARRLLDADRHPRIVRFVEAMVAWQAGRDHEAVARLAELLGFWPDDLVALKFCQILQLGIGDVAGMLRTAAASVAAGPDSGFAEGMLAFALDQAGETDRAETYARRAIDRNPVLDPWAQHALAHVYAAREEWVQGRALARACSDQWQRCSSFMRTHNWWHAALFSLELGQPEEALALFDAQVWGVRKGHCQDQVNAISLLARLELAGLDGGERWQDIARHVAPHALDGISSFLDLHFLYALARAGDDMLARELERAIDLPLAAGLVAHARGRHGEAANAFTSAPWRLQHLGGSQIQRATFDLIRRDSLVRGREQCRRYA